MVITNELMKKHIPLNFFLMLYREAEILPYAGHEEGCFINFSDSKYFLIPRLASNIHM